MELKVLCDIIILLLTAILAVLGWMINKASTYKNESNQWKALHHAEQVRQAEQIKNIENEVRNVKDKDSR